MKISLTTQFIISIVIFSVIGSLSVAGVLSAETWGEILTEEEKARYRQDWESGVLHEGNIHAFFDRFERAPNRKTAYNSTLNTGFTGNVGREWQSIKDGFADPMIVTDILKKQFSDRGLVKAQ